MQEIVKEKILSVTISSKSSNLQSICAENISKQLEYRTCKVPNSKDVLLAAYVFIDSR